MNGAMTPDSYSWHPTRDGFGTLLGPRNDQGGYPYVAFGITYEQALAEYGDVVREGQPVPIVVDVP